MRLGTVVLPTDRSAPIHDLAVAVESRGLDSLYIGGDHAHIPAIRSTPFPVAGGLPDEYRRTIDPVAAIAAASMVTTTLRLGTCIYLVAQRDAIDTAKKFASLDHLAPGRIDLGVGYGWNVEEAEDHGVDWKSRRSLVREQIAAIRALWTAEEATFHGSYVSFDRAWAWPKPNPAALPRVILGASPGPRTLDDIVAWADGWFPVPYWGHQPADVLALRNRAADAGRDPSTIAIVVDGLVPESEVLDPWQEVDAESALVPIPSEPLDDVLPILDKAAALVDHYR